MNGNFSVKRSRGKFNKVPSDQTIEQTINREQKCRGGITGFSTSEGTVQRWVLTSHTTSKCIAELEKDLSITSRPSVPKELGKSRKLFNNSAVKRAYDVMLNWGSPFEKRDTLINVCSGVEATADIQNDLLKAEQLGTNAFKTFLEKRIQSSEVSFYAPIKKLSLKSFKHMQVKKTVKLKEKSVTLAAERSMFGRLLVIAQNRDGLSLKDVLRYSLSPIPWSLGLPDGSIVKTVKSKLLAEIESHCGAMTVNQCLTDAGNIFDGMVLLQKLGNVDLLTFGDVSEFVLKQIMKSNFVYFVTDQYKDGSIKSFERSRRGASGSIRIKIERREQNRPRQWSKFLQDPRNKIDLINFLLRDWSNAPELSTYISERHTVDTDIAVYALYFEYSLNLRLYLDIGTGTNRRILDIKGMAQELGMDCCLALPALHAFTGNNYTSAFHSIGKAKAFKLMRESNEFMAAFQKMGNSFIYEANTFSTVEAFVSRLYGLKCQNINEARYLKFCAKSRATEPQKLPPTRDALLCHCKRVCYVTAIVRRSLENNPRIPSPDNHGWVVTNNELKIQWMLLPPAPEQASTDFL